MCEEAGDVLPGSGIDVVVLRTAGRLAVPVLGETAFDVESADEPDDRLLSELLDSTVRVTDAEGLPVALLDALARVPVPPTFRASPWLVASRPAYIDDNGTGRIADLPVRYTPRRGLQIQHPEPTEQLSEDWEG